MRGRVCCLSTNLDQRRYRQYPVDISQQQSSHDGKMLLDINIDEAYAASIFNMLPVHGLLTPDGSSASHYYRFHGTNPPIGNFKPLVVLPSANARHPPVFHQT
jgi:hypothetical protein